MERRPIKAIVFDMAGTTVDEQNIVYQSVQQALEKHGFLFEVKEVTLKIGGMSKKEGIEQLVKERIKEYAPDLIRRIFDDFMTIVEARYRNDDRVREKQGASDLFRFLHKKEIKVALDTGYSRSTADLLLQRMTWGKEELVDYSVTSDEVEKGRPEPFMIRKISDYFGCAPSELMKVGDTQADIDEGHNAGCRLIVGISSSKHDKSRLLDMGATHAVDELEEIKTLIHE